MSTSRPPKYSRSKEKNRPDRAYAWLDGKKVWLGRYGSFESRVQYSKLVTGVDTEERPAPSGDPTISELIVGYLEHAKVYYRKRDGNLSEEYHHNRRVCAMLRLEAGSDLARDFGPKKLKLLREDMIAKKWSRSYVNDQVKRIVRMFRFSASEEMIPAAVSDALKTIEGLRKGRSLAKEAKNVRPVPIEVVEATLGELPEVLADMARIQLLTGMRPGEICCMRPGDLDRGGEVWLFIPAFHKTDYRGHQRIIAIGPKAQGVLLKYLARAADAYCFQPKDSETKRLAQREADRVTPKSCGNRRGTNCNGTFQAGEVYCVKAYARAITRAAKRAGVEHWTPHRLRHTKATEVRKEFGLDSCQAMLGHRNAKVSEVYGELSTDKAVEVALRIG